MNKELNQEEVYEIFLRKMLSNGKTDMEKQAIAVTLKKIINKIISEGCRAKEGDKKKW